jgi:hypothetical protein
MGKDMKLLDRSTSLKPASPSGDGVATLKE